MEGVWKTGDPHLLSVYQFRDPSKRKTRGRKNAHVGMENQWMGNDCLQSLWGWWWLTEGVVIKIFLTRTKSN